MTADSLIVQSGKEKSAWDYVRISQSVSQSVSLLVCLEFKLLPWNEYWFLVLGFLHGVRGEFSDDVSGAAVGPIFTGHESERK